jgi:hypothetical protein
MMTVTQRIELLTHPVGDQPSAPFQWGFRIDGTDLRVLVADATRDLWRQEHEEETEAEQERFLLTQHDGLHASEIGDPPHHFLGDPAPEFACPATGATPLLGCVCGVRSCRPLAALITATPATVG